MKFGEVVRLGKDRCDPAAEGIERYIGLEHIEPGDLRVRSWGDVSDGTTFTTRVRPGHVLFGKRRAYQRKVAVADFDAVCSGDIYVFESANPAKLLPELLPFLCQTDAFFDHAVGTSAGSLSPRTNWTSLAEYEFALPPPEEQRSMVRGLVAFAASVDACRALVSSGAQLLSSCRTEHFSSLSPSTYGILAGAVRSSAYGPRFAGENYSADGNVRSIRTTDMPTFGQLTLQTAPRAMVPADVACEHRVRDGDFLISRTGFTSGRAAVFADPGGDEVYIPAAFLVRLRLDVSKLEPAYLLEYIQTPNGWEMIRGLQRGTQQLNISASGLVARAVPLPDVSVQRAFLREFAEVQAAATSAKLRLSHAMRLQHSGIKACLGGHA